MKKSKLELKNNRKGITLIALVITIIVLLILAGVSIATLTGQNGILTQANIAKVQTEISAVKEQARLDIMAWQTDNIEKGIDSKLNDDVVKNILNGRDYISGFNEEDEDDIKVITKSGYEIPLSELYEENEGITAGEISNSKDKTQFYGKEIEYNCDVEGIDGWQIFYADNENIYLITKYTIENDKIPPSANHSPNANGWFGDVYLDYNGATDIRNDDIKKWLNEYLKNNSQSVNMNIKYVAYMLDTNVWKQYASDKAEYAVGGPTIELFCASYNQLNGTKINYMSNEVGYKVKWENDNEWIDSLDITEDPLYYNRGDYYNLASPASLYDDYTCAVFNGDIGCNSAYNNVDIGFRPIVCLKEGTELLLKEDGTYSIK